MSSDEYRKLFGFDRPSDVEQRKDHMTEKDCLVAMVKGWGNWCKIQHGGGIGHLYPFTGGVGAHAAFMLL